eukprot:gnl/Chilomastix_cuspidata/2458.p1 GENE.gnl/Chilomastix_cuspidata/2458~~gnl/Chilomastix_cuspidata/2458.p1  ORF type:complete len:952 (+),score=162.49 gnl/Chilomastix_cuspidata/2458:56-2911(+)
MAHFALLIALLSFQLSYSLTSSFEIENLESLNDVTFSFSNKTILTIGIHYNNTILIESVDAQLSCSYETDSSGSSLQGACEINIPETSVVLYFPDSMSCDFSLESLQLSSDVIFVFRTDFSTTHAVFEVFEHIALVTGLQNKNLIDSLLIRTQSPATVLVSGFEGGALSIEGFATATLYSVSLSAFQAFAMHGSLAVTRSFIDSFFVASPVAVNVSQLYSAEAYVSTGSMPVAYDLSLIDLNVLAQTCAAPTITIQTTSGDVELHLPSVMFMDWMFTLATEVASGAATLDVGIHATPLSQDPLSVYIFEPSFHVPNNVFQFSVASESGRLAATREDFSITPWSGLKDCSNLDGASCPVVATDVAEIHSRHSLGNFGISAPFLISSVGMENWYTEKASIFATAFPKANGLFFRREDLDTWDVSCSLEQTGVLSCTSKQPSSNFWSFGLVVTGNSSVQTISPEANCSNATVSLPFDNIESLSVHITGHACDQQLEKCADSAQSGVFKNIIAHSIQINSTACDGVLLDFVSARSIAVSASHFKGSFSSLAPYAFQGRLENAGNHVIYYTNAVENSNAALLPLRAGEAIFVGDSDSCEACPTISAEGRGIFSFFGNSTAVFSVANFSRVEVVFSDATEIAQVLSAPTHSLLAISLPSLVDLPDQISAEALNGTLRVEVLIEHTVIVYISRTNELAPGAELLISLAGGASQIILERTFQTDFNVVEFSASVFETPTLLQPRTRISATRCFVNELCRPVSLNVSAQLVSLGVSEHWNGAVDVRTRDECVHGACTALFYATPGSAMLHSITQNASFLSIQGYFRGDEGLISVRDAQNVYIRVLPKTVPDIGISLLIALLFVAFLAFLSIMFLPLSRCMPWGSTPVNPHGRSFLFTATSTVPSAGSSFFHELSLPFPRALAPRAVQPLGPAPICITPPFSFESTVCTAESTPRAAATGL